MSGDFISFKVNSFCFANLISYLNLKESFARQSKNLLVKWPVYTRRMTIRRWPVEMNPSPKSAAFSTRNWINSSVRCTKKPRPSTLPLQGPVSTRMTHPITLTLPYVLFFLPSIDPISVDRCVHMFLSTLLGTSGNHQKFQRGQRIAQ